MRAPTFRKDYGWRSRPVFAALHLRPPSAQHTVAEGELLRRSAAGRRTIVEIGVAEGGSAWEMGQVMAPDGTMYLIDPYTDNTIGNLSFALRAARSLVEPVSGGRVQWLRTYSHEAVREWSRPIDFLFIDGDHSYDGVRRDWDEWSPHVRHDGLIALHDARVEAVWTKPHDGPVRLVPEVTLRGWREVGHADSLVVLSREA